MRDKRDERLLLLGAALAGVALGIDLLLHGFTETPVLPAVVPFTVVSLVLCLFVWMRARLLRLEEDERRDQELARRESDRARLFEDEDFEPFSVAKGRAQFERFVVTPMAPLLALVQGVWAWRLLAAWHSVERAPAEELQAAAVLAAQAFVLFLLSRYLLALSRQTSSRLLRGPGIVLGTTCLASVVAALGLVISHAVYPPAARLVYGVLSAYLGLLALESLLNFLGEIYRPRARDAVNVSYESRLSGLFTDPASWVNSLAQALDYQFGFGVSETWFYQFLRRALLPLLLFQLVVLYLLSSLVFIQPYEEGIRERFGRPLPDAWRLESGIHLKWPWPFETVRRFPAKRVQSLRIGIQREEAPGPGDTFLWTEQHHADEDLFLVATRRQGTNDTENTSVPVGFLNVEIPVEYVISNVFDYAYNFADPGSVLADLADRTFSLETARNDLFEMMSAGKAELADRLQSRLQAQADEMALGVEITFVGLHGIHPPSAVVPAFEGVIGAIEEREAKILRARAEAVRQLPLAKANAHDVKRKAEAYAFRRSAIAGAEIDRFHQQMTGYQASPSVFRTRWFLRTLRDGLEDTRKYVVVADPETEVLQFNFEEKLSSDAFDWGPDSIRPENP